MSGIFFKAGRGFLTKAGFVGTGTVALGALGFSLKEVRPSSDSDNQRFWPKQTIKNVWKTFGPQALYAKSSTGNDFPVGTNPPTAKGKAQLCGKRGPMSCCNSQCIITSDPKCYSLFLWIHLSPQAQPCCVAKVAADVCSQVEAVRDPCDDPCGCEEVVAGVGFGPNFYSQVMGKTCKNFFYTNRKGANGDMPASGGDVFLHAKCNSLGKLFDLCKNYICSFPEGSICEFEDVYGFDFKNGRDLSCFLDNRTNRCDDDGRSQVAIECETGGSYALAQKWVHDFCIIRPENKHCLEKYIGRDMDCGYELSCKTATSHVARMKGSEACNAPPQCEIMRHSQNYGQLANDAGMFFMAYARDPCAFEFMLDNMVGAGCDTCCDDVMKISKNVKGSYFYFPSLKELCALTNSA